MSRQSVCPTSIAEVATANVRRAFPANSGVPCEFRDHHEVRIDLLYTFSRFISRIHHRLTRSPSFLFLLRRDRPWPAPFLSIPGRHWLWALLSLGFQPSRPPGPAPCRRPTSSPRLDEHPPCTYGHACCTPPAPLCRLAYLSRGSSLRRWPARRALADRPASPTAPPWPAAQFPPWPPLFPSMRAPLCFRMNSAS